MKLYGFPASPNTWKVRALAAHIGLPLELAFVDLTKGEQRAPSFLKLNPTGRTPVLVDGDFQLWESEAILAYVASQKKTPLYPEGAKARADILRWQSWSLRHWGAQACDPLIFENLVKVIMSIGSPDPTAVAAAEKAFHQEATVLDAHLAKHRHLAGDALTIADFSVAAPLFHAQSSKMPVSDYANVMRWFGAVSALPCWAETAPKM